MKRILFIYPPFCTPASPPYSIANLYGFLKNNLDSDYKLEVLDLNIMFHNQKYEKYEDYYTSLKEGFDKQDYDKTTKEFLLKTKEDYTKNNNFVVNGKKPDMFDELFNEIIIRKPDIVALSIVYSSQSFYAYALVEELRKTGIKSIIGGPAVNEKLRKSADLTLKNELELLEHISQKDICHEKINFDYYPDFSIFNKNTYFTPSMVIPIKTTSACYYKQCAFCSHHGNNAYFEFSLEQIKKTIVNSKQKNFFLVDDMIHKKRLLDLAKILKPLKVSWMCQLRPTKEFDYETLKELHESGLKLVIWGVESGNDRILKLMRKSTNKENINDVLEATRKAGIRNCVFIMFGFPTETKEEFLETIDFLEYNEKNIDLISTSIFGLQKGTPIYANPKDFGITKIIEEKRTILEPKISYEVISGLTQEEAIKLRRGYKRTIEKINKYPKEMNFFREHLLILS